MSDGDRIYKGRAVIVDWRGDDNVFNADDLQFSEALTAVSTLSASIFTRDAKLTPNNLLGSRFKFTFPTALGERSFSGICAEAERSPSAKDVARFAVTVRPWLWSLGQNLDTRIFQNLTCIGVAKEIFSDYASAKFEDKTSSAHDEIIYTVQYDETDLNFLTRTLEDHGVYYYIRNDPDGEVVVLCDGPGGHKPVPGAEKIAYFDPEARFKRDQEHIYHFDQTNVLVPNEVTKTDNDFEKVRGDLQVKLPVPDQPKPADKMKIYIPQAGHTEVDQGEQKVKLAVEALRAGQHLVSSACNVRTMAVGFTFTLTGHDIKAYNRDYLVVSAHHILVGEHDFSDGGGGDDEYSCHFEAIPRDRPYRPKRLTPKPRIHSLQTAVVTGPKGEEIYTDKYGRVKVQFHWDRVGKRDEKTTCWIRVASPWVGQKWGALTIPRIGQEVTVQFENGDPDRPIVTGMLYNAENMPPYDLPGAATQSGFKSNSSKGGGGANEIQMEDKKGQEKFNITAERDYSLTVKNDARMKVGYEVGAPGSYFFDVHQDRIESVSNGNYELGVDMGGRTVFVKATDDLTVEGDRVETITGCLRVLAGCIELTAQEHIVLTVGSSTIVIHQSGIDIDGPVVNINCK